MTRPTITLSGETVPRERIEPLLAGGSLLVGAALRRMSFRNAILKGLDFADADLSGCDFARPTSAA